MAEISINEIMKLLPHRYPMLLVDKVIEYTDEKHIIGIKNLTFNELFFQGHFPDEPILPGVLELEAMAQVGGILLSRKTGMKRNIPVLMAIDKAKFRKIVRPGDQLRIEVDVTSSRPKMIRCCGKTFVEEKLAAEAELLFMFTDKKAE